MWRLESVGTTQPKAAEEKWRDGLPSDISTKIAETAIVPAWQLYYAGTTEKAGRQIAMLSEAPAGKPANRWVVAPQSASACNLGYVAYASKIESKTSLTPREKLDGTLAHFAVAYGQCSADTSIPAIVIRYRYGVALKDMCRHHAFLTCGEAFKVLADVLTDIKKPAYSSLIEKSPDKPARVFEKQVLDGIREIFFYAIEKTTYFKQSAKSWRKVDICPLLEGIRTHELAPKDVQEQARKNRTALGCTT